MSGMNNYKGHRSLSSWVSMMRDGILLSDVDEKTALAVCGHLADLGVLEQAEGEEWQLTNSDESMPDQSGLLHRLNDICRTEQGFALRYFLKNPPDSPDANSSHDPEPDAKKGEPVKNPQLLTQKTSNLSNLQIVKKYGRQVESFVELEKSFTQKLLGPNTSAKEARKIFNFILSRIQQKTEPRSWEQLSRRRHK